MLLPSPVVEIKDAPAILGCSQNPTLDQDKYINFLIYVCPFCGLIQTNARLDSQSYEITHSHAVGGVWAEHGNKLAEFISECLGSRLEKLKTALEIGPSVSPILKRLSLVIPFIQYIDLMNEAPFKLATNEQYKKQPFPSTQLQGKFDLIVASHVLEHAESLYGFIDAIKRHLAVSGIAILSIPNFHEWLTKKYWNAITSEHLNYPFIEHMQDLCVWLGLDAEFAYFKLHSVFMQVSHLPKDKRSSKSLQGRIRENTRQMLEDWVIEINSKIAMYEEAIGYTSQEVILAGASHLSQYVVLISERIRSRVKIVLDNAADKHGKRLYGTELTVYPFDIVRKFQCPMVIVPPSPYVGEMTVQVLNLNASSQIIS
jgi:SAM-dependent methyltransferase